GKVCVVRTGKVLGLCPDKIISETAAPKVVLLKVPRRLGETKLIHEVVIAIRPEEQVGHDAVAVVRPYGRVARSRYPRDRIVRKIEYSEGIAAWPSGGIDSVGRYDIQTGIDVVARSRVSTIGDPTKVVECGQFANEREKRAAYRRALNARSRNGIRGRKRRRAIVVVDRVGCRLSLFVGDVFAPQQLSTFRVHDRIIGRVVFPYHH